MSFTLDLDTKTNGNNAVTDYPPPTTTAVDLFANAKMTTGHESPRVDSVTVALDGGPTAGESLSVDLARLDDDIRHEFTIDYNSVTGVLTITSTDQNGAPAGDWTTILKHVQYTDTASHASGTRTIKVTATDTNSTSQSAEDTVEYCFMAGTMIRTPNGEVPVETLKRGDLVMTANGEAQPVSWLGRQTVASIFGDPLRVRPIRIKGGAFGENTPSRDLLISPDHAVLVDGVLIQAGALVNGTSIVRETKVPAIFVYYHVELDDHSLILAENVAAETFIDNVDRLAFDNWAEHQALYPQGKEISEMPYPRAKASRQVPEATRQRLAARGEALCEGNLASVA